MKVLCSPVYTQEMRRLAVKRKRTLPVLSDCVFGQVCSLLYGTNGASLLLITSVIFRKLCSDVPMVFSFAGVITVDYLVARVGPEAEGIGKIADTFILYNHKTFIPVIRFHVIEPAGDIFHIVIFQGLDGGRGGFGFLQNLFLHVLHGLPEILRRDLLPEFSGDLGIDLCQFLKVFRLFSVIEQLFCPLVCTQSIQELQCAFF